MSTTPKKTCREHQFVCDLAFSRLESSSMVRFVMADERAEPWLRSRLP
jgi:hypothetical protein